MYHFVHDQCLPKVDCFHFCLLQQCTMNVFPSIGSICSQQLILGFFNCFIICEETLKKSKVFGAYNKIILLCLIGKLFGKLLLVYK